jgi:hypothetical protein
VRRKRSCGVRGGAVGKVPIRATRWRPTLRQVRFGRGNEEKYCKQQRVLLLSLQIDGGKAGQYGNSDGRCRKAWGEGGFADLLQAGRRGRRISLVQGRGRDRAPQRRCGLGPCRQRGLGICPHPKHQRRGAQAASGAGTVSIARMARATGGMVIMGQLLAWALCVVW